MPRLAAASLALALAAAPAAAQEPAAPSPTPTPIAEAIENAGAALAGQPQPPRPSIDTPDRSRPAALMPLYVSFVALQGLDVHSTRRALGNGAREGNPFMKGVAGSKAGLVTVKAASTAGIVYATEKLRKRHPVLAVALMAGLNSAMAFVVQHNYRAGR